MADNDFKNYVSQKKNVIQYPHFTKLIIADLMKKFPSIPPTIEEDYHSIKYDITLVSVYTTGNKTIRGMLIPDAFLTKEIRVTDDFKESTPGAYRIPTLTAASPQGKKRKQSVGELSSPQKSLKITIRQEQVGGGEKAEQSYDDVNDSDNRLEPGSHKENPKHVDDDDDKEEEEVDEKEGNKMGRIDGYCITLTPTTFKDPHKQRRIFSKYSHLPGALHRMCKRQGYMIRNMEQKCVPTSKFWK
ncbi:hypothetical protein Tco_1339328, partial [Tanacetum coccineum]